MTPTPKAPGPLRCVVKVGGDVIEDASERHGLGGNVRDLLDEGWQVSILHGGGPQVSRLQNRLGLSPQKIGGRRVTRPEDLEAVQMALCGQTNVALTTALLDAGVDALGLHGASGRLIQAHKRPPRKVSGGGNEPVDFGCVGDVAHIRATLLDDLCGLGLVPTIATLGVDSPGQEEKRKGADAPARTFNINADTTSVRLAQAWNAGLLLLTTRVGGIFRDLENPESRIQEIQAHQARDLIRDGVIAGGMIPKVEEALEVLGRGVGAIAIVNASQPGAFAAIARGDPAVGTRILP